ncbi:hypothetical protein PM082_004583 [Marasmius tenuissimus]|nr:hypothetical protein PM082_004583 [Marasmius tenuissimus]
MRGCRKAVRHAELSILPCVFARSIDTEAFDRALLVLSWTKGELVVASKVVRERTMARYDDLFEWNSLVGRTFGGEGIIVHLEYRLYWQGDGRIWLRVEMGSETTDVFSSHGGLVSSETAKAQF